MNKQIISNASFEGERPLFGIHHVRLERVSILPGESALKECSDIEAVNCEFNGKYPFWHVDGFTVKDCLFHPGARAALWYSRRLVMEDTRVDAPKMFRDMDGITLKNVVLTDALETLWHCENISLDGVQADHGDYIFMFSNHVKAQNFTLNGNYSFQYCKGVEIRNSHLNSKDAFWNTQDVTVYDSVLNGEYLGWYSKNLRLVNCHISGTQPLCYIENLVLENCTFGEDCDLCFENSAVQASIRGHIHSVKNPRTGRIVADSIGEVILDGQGWAPCDCMIETAQN